LAPDGQPARPTIPNANPENPDSGNWLIRERPDMPAPANQSPKQSVSRARQLSLSVADSSHVDVSFRSVDRNRRPGQGRRLCRKTEYSNRLALMETDSFAGFVPDYREFSPRLP